MNSVHPGGALADMLAQTLPEDARSVVISAGIPMSRMADPAEVAKMVLFLALEASSYTTGSGLIVDGGLTAV